MTEREKLRARERANEYRLKFPERCRENKRRWYLANKDKVKARSKKWHSANADRVRLLRLENRNNNRSRYRDLSKKWRAANSDKCKAYRDSKKGTVAQKQWWDNYYAKNKEKIRLRARLHYLNNKEDRYRKIRLWIKNNPDKLLAFRRNRRAKKLGASGVVTPGIEAMLLVKQSGRCAYCKTDITKKRHLDHIIPLCRNGRHEDENLQLTCPKCNQQKSSLLPDEFKRRHGYV